MGIRSVIDVRNEYESEVGHFRGAITPKVQNFRDSLSIIENLLKGKENEKILTYCTGGIRCSKVAIYLEERGFKNVYQLEGGIIKYAHDIRRLQLNSAFIGKNFSFDKRLGERITDEVIAKCHQCHQPCDTHRNCANSYCDQLFIQCDDCKKRLLGLCPNCSPSSIIQ
eukprot:TRINITY_DN14083_c0_g1_i1.p1 TRINITY_DN14083_c0_g1~~TRINITY_DN14083_c0_g1_i1.p1  ORF type:complete len:168 (-),score=13.07 TRINITY_DN14083_c0_g1_i1:95-598(-)